MQNDKRDARRVADQQLSRIPCSIVLKISPFDLRRYRTNVKSQRNFSIRSVEIVRASLRMRTNDAVESHRVVRSHRFVSLANTEMLLHPSSIDIVDGVAYLGLRRSSAADRASMQRPRGRNGTKWNETRQLILARGREKEEQCVVLRQRRLRNAKEGRE